MKGSFTERLEFSATLSIWPLTKHNILDIILECLRDYSRRKKWKIFIRQSFSLLALQTRSRTNKYIIVLPILLRPIQFLTNVVFLCKDISFLIRNGAVKSNRPYLAKWIFFSNILLCFTYYLRRILQKRPVLEVRTRNPIRRWNSLTRSKFHVANFYVRL